ncbi:MAG TPA: cytochrome P460 family protein [bacterium]|nr:cytochrome P460 family protein [bacterium]
MQRKRWWRLAAVLIGTALLWALAGGLGTTIAPQRALAAKWWLADSKADSEAKKEPEAPAEPEKATAEQPPAEPEQAEPAATEAKPEPEAPAEPMKAAAEPAKEAPAAMAAPEPPKEPAASAEPMAPAAPGDMIDWAQDYRTWDVATGYVLSDAHGHRLLQTFIHPHKAAEVYRHNSQLALLRKTKGFEPYPVGTEIVAESWTRNGLGAPGKAGPVVFMRKHGPGYDPAGGDWEYAIAEPNLALMGEGHTGKMAFCKECHTRVQSRDFVYATER